MEVVFRAVDDGQHIAAKWVYYSQQKACTPKRFAMRYTATPTWQSTVSILCGTVPRSPKAFPGARDDPLVGSSGAPNRTASRMLCSGQMSLKSPKHENLSCFERHLSLSVARAVTTSFKNRSNDNHSREDTICCVVDRIPDLKNLGSKYTPLSLLVLRKRDTAERIH